MMGYGIIGIAILVLLLSLAGFVVAHDHSIRAAQKAADEAAVLSCQNNEATCKLSNETLADSCKKIGVERDEQSAAVLKWAGYAKEAVEISNFWKGKFQATQTRLAAGQQDAHAKGLRPADPTQTCQQVLDEMDADDKIWLPERDVRMRDLLGLPAKPDVLKVGK